MRAALLASSALLALTLRAPAHALSHGRHGPQTACLYRFGSSDDLACDQLVAAGQVGQYTVSSQNAGLGLFTYARQSGQNPSGYYSAPSTISSHPVRANVPGEDYGVGHWTPTAGLTLVNQSTASGISINSNCTWTASSHYYRCNLPSTSFQGSVSSGVITTDGTALTPGSYVYSGLAAAPYAPYQVTASPGQSCNGSTLGANQYCLASKPDMNTGFFAAQGTALASASGTILTVSSGAYPTVGQFVTIPSLSATYQVTGSLGGGRYSLDRSAGAATAYQSLTISAWVPQTTAPNVGTQTFSTSVKLKISGYWFDDVGVYFGSGGTTGYVELSNDRITIGSNTCTLWNGAGPINGSYANTPMKVWGNYAGFDTSCSNSAELYNGGANPAGGQPQASFVGKIVNGTELDIVSGTNPAVGQYIDYTVAGFGDQGVPAQIGARSTTGCTSGSTCYILSTPEPNVTNAAMTTGPILNKSTTTFVMPAGAGPQDIEFNYSDKQSYLATSNDMGAVMFAHNLVDIIGQPAEHTSPWLQEAFPYQGTFGVSFVGTISTGAPNQIVTSSGSAPQVGWLVSTANNTIDHSFTTARVTAVSGTGPYTIALDTSEPAHAGVTFYSGVLYNIPYDAQDSNAIIFEANTAAGPLPGWTGCLGLASVTSGSPTVSIIALYNCPGGPGVGNGSVLSFSNIVGTIQTVWSPTLSGGTGGLGSYTGSSNAPIGFTGSILFSYPYPSWSNWYSGGGGGVLLEGGGNSAATFFTTNGFGNRVPSASTGYYVNYTYVEAKNNVWIVNSSANNSNHIRTAGAHGSRTLWQGSGWGSNIGAYPGSVSAGLFSGNFLDPAGASVGCISVDTGTDAVYTQPAGGAPYVPTTTGNVDLYDGSTISGSSCNGSGP